MKKYIASVVLALLTTGIFYYVLTPAINIHSMGFWVMLVFAFVMLNVGFIVTDIKHTVVDKEPSKGTLVLWGIAGVLVVVFAIGNLLGLQLFRAGTYASIAENRMETREFLEDVKEAEEINNIALMDTDSAQIIGNRQLGSLSSLVSQFETSDYSTITIEDQPMKVSALGYVNFFRFIRNRNTGVPGYIQVNPVSQKAGYVELEKGMKYVPSAYFNKNLLRHLHFAYPTAIVEEFNFEIDEEGNPYYVCPYYVYHAGLFGARDVGGVIVVDPVTGEMEQYEVEEVPEWIDRVYDGDILCDQYDWYGNLKNGFINAQFSKTGCVITTDDYGFKSLDGDIWIFTGVTSVASDQSNVGFVLMNCRTGEIRYYDIFGAEEFSAMSAAEGLVQDLGYSAAFPSIINVNDEPVYIMVLKDSGGLTKMYALVNLQDYSIVAIGDTQTEALNAYKKKIGVEVGAEDVSEEEETTYQNEVEITISSMEYVTIDGNTYVYLISDGKAYKILVKDNEAVVLLAPGMQQKLLCDDLENDIIGAELP